MVDVSKLVKNSLLNLTPYTHGGNVWQVAEKYGIPLEQIIDFSISTNPLGAPEKAVEAIRSHLHLINHYPDQNPEWLLETLAESVGVESSNVIVGNGSTELIYLFSEVFLGDDHEAVIPVPSFSEYKAAIERFGGNIVFVQCSSANNFRLKLEELEEAVTGHTRIIFFCNPNSPTGCLYEKRDVLRVVEFASEHDVLVFLDEDYIDFVEDDHKFSLAAHVNDYSNLFVLRSLTKFFGLAGVRIGFGVGSPELLKFLRNIRMPWSVNSLAMYAAAEAVKDREFVKRSRALLEKSRSELREMLNSLGWLKVYPSETNFLLIEILRKDLTSTRLAEALAKKGILIRDCRDFDGLDDRFFRVAVRMPEQNRKLVEQLKTIGGSL